MAELCHHGILGMKWGVRKFQNKDGSLTAAGRKRYDTDIKSAEQRVQKAKADAKEAKRAMQREAVANTFINGGAASKETREKYKNALDRTEWEKKKLSDEKTKGALNRTSGKKSKHRIALEQKYMEKGMSAEEAEVAAYKRIRTERAIAVAGGVTIAAAAAYTAYKHWDLNADKILKSGVELKNISNTDKLDVSRQFYAAYKKPDVKKYLGLYGGQIIGGQGPDAVKQTTIGINGSLKIAGRKTAAKTLADMVGKNPELLNSLKDDLESYRTRVSGAFTSAGKSLTRRAERDLSRGKISKNVYDVLNSVQTLGGGQSGAGKQLYSELTKAGYDAIIDVNDKKYGGYNAKSPVIVFNGAAKTVVKAVRNVSENEVSKASVPETAKVMVSQYLKSQIPWAAAGAATAATVKGVKAHNNIQKRNLIVSEYKKEHPGTKLTYDQILNNYYGSK